jgi:glycosyltransferase involved in cell wall biosynthesis
VKLAVVVQRYGAAVNGGAELHARYVAERLGRSATVEVLTTCATDYVTWRNELPAGVEQINGVSVRRFPVRHERDPIHFGKLSAHVFHQPHSAADELSWLEAEGPASPSLVRYVSAHASDYDYLLFFSYRYYHAYHGVRAAAAKAVLVPTAERDPAIGISIFGPIFRGVRALMYNSPEEQALIEGVAANASVPSVIVGVGSDVPASPQPGRFRQKFGIRDGFAIYVGRIDANKGCAELFAHFDQYLRSGGGLTLVLIGNSLLPIPEHPQIRHLGFLADADKFDAIAAADLLIMPSYFESLSMVALEAWALGKPVLANGRCDVLKGQCLRSNAGLYYQDAPEFIETLRTLEQNRWVSGTLGRNGREFFREHYAWPVIERKYLDMFSRLSAEPAPSQIEPGPGWFSRWRRDRPPAAQVVEALPHGPAVVQELTAPRPASRPPAAAAPPPLPPPRRPGRDVRPHRPPRRNGPRFGRSSRSGGA